MKKILFLLVLALSFLWSLPSVAGVDLVFVDKSDRVMIFLEKGKELKRFAIALGANPKGHKQKEGDEKTPEGEYVLDYKKEDSAFYRAMHVSYPNDQDVQNAKSNGVDPGGFIMVHGQKNRFGWAGG